jgi:hypothetical protein
MDRPSGWLRCIRTNWSLLKAKATSAFNSKRALPVRTIQGQGLNRIASKEDLLAMLSVMSQPKKHGLTQAALELVLINFCAGCPDPIGAYRLIVECFDPMTDEELIHRALEMPVLLMKDVPTSIVPAQHPARTMRDSTKSLQ